MPTVVICWQSSLTRQAPIILGYRKSPPDATLNFHPFANAVSEWDANERDGVDRTKDELIEDAKSIYEEYGKLFNGGSMK